MRGGRLVTGGAEPAGLAPGTARARRPGWSAAPSTHAASRPRAHPRAHRRHAARRPAAAGSCRAGAGAALPAFGERQEQRRRGRHGRPRSRRHARRRLDPAEPATSALATNARFALDAAGATMLDRSEFSRATTGTARAIGYSQHSGRLDRAARRARPGGARPDGRARPPARPARGGEGDASCRRRDIAYVDSVAGILARARRPAEALQPIRAETQAHIAQRRRASRRRRTRGAQAAARQAGPVGRRDRGAMLGLPDSDDAVLSAGRARVHAGRTDTRSDE